MSRTKVIQGRNYGSIPHLSDSKIGSHDKYLTEGQEKIIRAGGRDRHDVVHVSLKLDGTNVGVLKRDGQLIGLQRKGYDCASSPYRQHHEFNNWMYANHNRLSALLNEGERLAGEWLWQASGIRYKIDGPPFMPFDLFRADGSRMPWADLVSHVCREGLEVPPSCSYTRKCKQHKGVYETLSNHCYAAPIDDMHEGLVYRVEREGKLDFMAKWVRPDYEAGKYLPGLCGLPKNAPLTLNELV